MQLAFDRNKFPAVMDPSAEQTITIGDGLFVQLKTDPRVNAGDVVLSRIFQVLASLESQVADLQTIVAALPSCARPEIAPLFANDPLADALTRVHDVIDHRAAFIAAMQAAAMPASEGSTT